MSSTLGSDVGGGAAAARARGALGFAGAAGSVGFDFADGRLAMGASPISSSIIAAMLTLLALMCGLAAGEPQAASGTFISADEIAATLKQSIANNTVDQP